MKKPIVNLAASVRQRLLNLARERNEDFGLVLTKYGLERVLYRISKSKYRDLFVLKGALLFELWTEQRYRPTRDADFLARGPNSLERFVETFKEICAFSVEDDGLVFDATTVTAERITEDADYKGIRVNFVARLERARVPIQIDLGFGDAIVPAAIKLELPTLLDQPAARLLTYSRESTIAEKFEAMVSLGLANSRMKDLHDIRSLAQQFQFDGEVLAEAIRKTFGTRGTKLPADQVLVFTPEFFKDAQKERQWAAFCNRNKAYVAEVSLQTASGDLAAFLMPLIDALNGKRPVPKKWAAGTWSN